MQTQYVLRSQQNLSGSKTHLTLYVHFSKTTRINFFQLFSAAADSYLTQLMTTVGIESHQPLITFCVKQKQGGLSFLLGITRKTVVFYSRN